jgi:hypothetical protein
LKPKENPLKFNTEFCENQVTWWIWPCNSILKGECLKGAKHKEHLKNFFQVHRGDSGNL